MSKRYEVFDKETNKYCGVYTKEAIDKIGLSDKNGFVVKELKEETELDQVKNEGRF